MIVKVYDHLNSPYPSIAFYSKRGKVVLNFVKRTVLVAERIREQGRVTSWRTILEASLK